MYRWTQIIAAMTVFIHALVAVQVGLLQAEPESPESGLLLAANESATQAETEKAPTPTNAAPPAKASTGGNLSPAAAVADARHPYLAALLEHGSEVAWRTYTADLEAAAKAFKPEALASSQVVVYTAASCVPCDALKQRLQASGVTVYTRRDVLQVSTAYAQARGIGAGDCMLPVLEIDGLTYIGFNPIGVQRWLQR